jgi:hypothetical protein
MANGLYILVKRYIYWSKDIYIGQKIYILVKRYIYRSIYIADRSYIYQKQKSKMYIIRRVAITFAMPC